MTEQKFLSIISDSVQKAISENKDELQKLLLIGINDNMDKNDALDVIINNCLNTSVSISTQLIFHYLISLGVIDPNNYADNLPNLYLVK